MAEQKSTKSGFSADERAAMRQRAAELKAQERKGKTPEEKQAMDRQELVDAIAALPEADRVLAERIDEIVADAAPHLTSRTWYGFPAYAKNGKLVVFFKPASKFKSRYATLGFEENANLDEGTMWQTSFAVTAIGDAEAKHIAELVARAAS